MRRGLLGPAAAQSAKRASYLWIFPACGLSLDGQHRAVQLISARWAMIHLPAKTQDCGIWCFGAGRRGP